ncbi:MAG: hypothetical protein HUJ68_11040 [Clostridia bacterium]|nr:hypothetical protein [Clostridia bacterium]
MLTATVPFFATSCNKDKSNIVAMSVVTSSIPEVTMVNSHPEDEEEVYFSCKFLNNAQHEVFDVVK